VTADIGLEDEGTTAGAAAFNPQLRTVTWHLGGDHSWAWKNTNSTLWDPFPFWSPSGAALFNMASYTDIRGSWWFNEVILRLTTHLPNVSIAL
jgi:hypothetical protein